MPAPMIDLDALRATGDPFRITVSGRTYTARPVSIEQVIAYEGQCIGASGEAVMRARRQLLRLAFPWRIAYVWRGDPVEKICGAEPWIHREIMDAFFQSLQSSANRSPTSGIKPTKNS